MSQNLINKAFSGDISINDNFKALYGVDMDLMKAVANGKRYGGVSDGVTAGLSGQYKHGPITASGYYAKNFDRFRGSSKYGTALQADIDNLTLTGSVDKIDSNDGRYSGITRTVKGKYTSEPGTLSASYTNKKDNFGYDSTTRDIKGMYNLNKNTHLDLSHSDSDGMYENIAGLGYNGKNAGVKATYTRNNKGYSTGVTVNWPIN